MTTLRLVMLVSVYLAVLTTVPEIKHVQASVVLTADGNTVNGNDVSGTGSGVDGTEGDGNLGNVEVIFTEPEAREESAGNVGRGDAGILDVGRMELMVDQLTRDDWMVFLCDGLQDSVRDCRGVQSIRNHLALHGQRLAGILAPNKRKRRSFNSPFFDGPWSGPSYGGSNNYGFSGWNYDFWPPHSPSSYNNPGAGHPGGWHSDQYVPPAKRNSSRVIVCPSPLQQSAVYQLSNDSSNYPVVDISAELIFPANAALYDCLLRELVIAGIGPTVLVDDLRKTATATCPFTEQRLWQFQSIRQGARCWVLANFGDVVQYRTCLERFCSNCTDPNTKHAHRGRYHGSSYNYNYGRTDDSYLYQKLCITDYRATSLWAYCPGNLLGQRIVRERIILPLTCNCLRVRCDPVSSPYSG